MKRIATWILCVVMLLALALPVCAAAQLQFTLTPSATAAQPGETVTFQVAVKGDAYTSLGYIPVYDTAVWEMVDGKCLFEDIVLGEFSLTDGGVLAYADAKVRDGVAFQFTLKVKNGAAAGTTAVTGMVAANNDADPVNATLTDAQITIGKDDGKPGETTAATQPEQLPPDAPEATMESQGTSQEEGSQSASPEATMGSQQSAEDAAGTEALNKEEMKDLEGGDSCLDGEDILTVGPSEPAAPVEKENPLPWIIAGAVVVAVAVAAWLFLRKKSDKTEE